MASVLFAGSAAAQRTDDNAVEDANDAFGRSIGGEQIGIYSPDNVRGFSPVVAGNVRIDGMYFDQQGYPTDRIIESRTVHVGISAQGYPFPAPTGIAGYSLRQPGAETILSAAASYGPYGGTNFEFDGELPIIGETLGLTAGHGIHRNTFDLGNKENTESYGLTLRFQPSDDFSIHPFYGRIDVQEIGRPPLIFTAGDFLPPEVERPEYHGQPWTGFEALVQNAGVVSRGRLSGFEIAAGLFRSQQEVEQNHNDLLFGTDQDGNVADRVVVADQDNRFSSTSGELRVSRPFTEGPRRHELMVSLRGRALNRRYGGSSVVSLGGSNSLERDFRPEPEFTYGAKSRDEIRQKTAGIGYSLRWRSVGEISLGLQKTDYQKSVTTPTEVLPTSKDKPWLFSATAAAHISSKLALFGGYTRGLEESEVAPANATNRNEAPPALRTRQQDIGVRYAISPRLSFIMGLFEVEKPYFNLDSNAQFRQLGTVSNRGAELSLAGQLTKRLTAVAGATYIDSRISGELVDNGTIGKRPVGAFKVRTLANVNWQLPWHEPLTLTARFESTTDRTANAANTFVIPARWVASFGGRYRTTVGNVPVLVRATVDNVFDRFGWGVGGGGFFIPNAPRRFSATVAADF